MKTAFPEYYRPTEEEFTALWKACVFGVDANVLLNLYGYSEGTRQQLLGLFERLSDRMRMPYQFALEYQRNRARAIMEQVKNYSKVESALAELYDKEFRSSNKHPFLTAKALNQFDYIRRELVKGRKQHEALFTKDPYFDRVTALLKVVSAKPTDEQLRGWYEQAKLRYANRVPPGYADLKEKGEPAAYGDFVGWSQLKEMAKQEGRPMILLTDDAKEDWWRIQGDRTIGPRPELLAEFRSESGTEFYMYSSAQFLRLAGKYLEQPVEQSVIDEVSARLFEQLMEPRSAKPEPKSVTDLTAPEKPYVIPEPAQIHEPKATEAPPSPIGKSETSVPKEEAQ